MSAKPAAIVLGAGYSGLTTAAELAIRGHTVTVKAAGLGMMPPLTISGTQSRRWYVPTIRYSYTG